MSSLAILPSDGEAQEIKSSPGKFDYYVLNLSWGPDFCSNLRTLSPVEQAAPGSAQCTPAGGVLLHGLWPQNFDGTYPAWCAERHGPMHPERYLDVTPSLPLLKHEWAKHGTCTELSPDMFFTEARRAYYSVRVPQPFLKIAGETAMPPGDILGMFYKANPAFPHGSLALACHTGQLVAVEACLDKQLHFVECRNIHSCNQPSITIVTHQKFN